MTCFIAKNMLSELMDGELPSARKAELEGHLSGCSGCSHELEQIRRVRTLLRALPVEKAPRDFLVKVRSRMEEKSAFEKLFSWVRLPGPKVSGALALAAVVALGVTVTMRVGLLSPFRMNAARPIGGESAANAPQADLPASGAPAAALEQTTPGALPAAPPAAVAGLVKDQEGKGGGGGALDGRLADRSKVASATGSDLKRDEDGLAFRAHATPPPAPAALAREERGASAHAMQDDLARKNALAEGARPEPTRVAIVAAKPPAPAAGREP